MSDERKTLLMISYPFPPNASAGAVRSERFARYLADFGWGAEVVTIRPRRDLFEDGQRLELLQERVRVNFTATWDPWLWLQDRKPRGITLRKLRGFLLRLFSFPDHMIFWVPFAVTQGLKIARKRRVWAIYTTSPPHSSHLAGLSLAKLTGIPLVVDFRDPWTLNAYHEKGGIQNLLLNLERVMERAVISRAKKVLANTESNRSNLLRAFPWIEEDKVIHLPNGWEEFEIPQQRAKEEAFTIVHSGTFYPRFRPYGLLEALAAWKRGIDQNGIARMPSIKVILLGARDSETKQTVIRLGLQDIVEIRPWVSLKEARDVMTRADLLWATLGTGKESSTYVPSKLLEYLAARRPVLGFFPEGEAATLIREAAIGIVFTADDPVPVIEFLTQACSMKRSEGHVSYEPNMVTIERYRIENIVRVFAAMLDSLDVTESWSEGVERT
jgi:glycosyltransferase involved in cell wall biosynthesis